MDITKGAYKLMSGDLDAADTDFDEVYQQAMLQWKAASPTARRAGKPAETANVAIADSGFFTADQYFRDRASSVDSVDFTLGYTLPRLTRGQPVTTGVHGSHVASIAGFGTTRIKLIDVQICRSQETGPQGAVWANALTWAVSQRPAVINCSVNVPWEQTAIQAVVSRNTGVLFVATAGNTDQEYGEAYRRQAGASFSSGNLIMVGGCGNAGQRIPNRGFGSAVDLFAPSVDIPGRADVNLQRLKFDYDQQRKRDARALEIGEETERNLQALKNAEDDLATTTGLAKALLENKIKAMRRPKAMPPYVSPPFAQTALSDSGASFALPMISNVAAKMMLINPSLSPASVIAMMTGSAEASPQLQGKILDPVAAYRAALESRGGT